MRTRSEILAMLLMIGTVGCGGEAPPATETRRTVPLSSPRPEPSGPPTEVIPASYTTSSLPPAPTAPDASPPAYSMWPNAPVGLLPSQISRENTPLEPSPSAGIPLPPPPPSLPGKAIRAEDLPPPPPLPN